MDELISIIIPIYNVEDVLWRCLDSVVNQTYKRLEIILVDDGSTDASCDIIKNFEKEDSRIKVIRKVNGGLSDARNAGLGIARGKYIVFVDSDDFVHLEYVKKLYGLLKDYDANIAAVELIKFSNPSQLNLRNRTKEKILEFDGIEAVQDLCYQKHIKNSAWGKIYESSLFSDVRYPVGVIYEDLATTYKLLNKANKVVWSSERLYFYFQRSGSIMNSGFRLENMDRIRVGKEILDWAQEECPLLETAAVSRYFISNVQVLREIPMTEEYFVQINSLWDNIVKYRGRVIFDGKAKIINRLIALSSYLGRSNLYRLGKLYKYVWK